MEGMEETVKSETHLTSAAAFVEGGIQVACDDACSICLEDFCDSDPSTVTSCKHEFHLQCVLEWCQRSSQCPMCWRPISLKDPTSQELLEAVERERSFRFNPSRNATIFHHPTLGDFELQHLPVGANDAELEERIIQHLAAAAAVGRRHIARREGQRNRSQGQGRPQFLVFSSQHNTSPADTIPSSPTHGEGESVPSNAVATPSSGSTNVSDVSSQVIMQVASGGQADVASPSASRSILLCTNQQDNYMNTRRSPNQPSPSSQQTATVSEFQSFSESIKSKFNAVSMRYKESISKSTRGWKERFFSRNTSMADQDSEVRRDANDGATTLSHMMEKLETRDGTTTSTSSTSNREKSSSHSAAELDNERTLEPGGGSSMSDTDLPASCTAASCSHQVQFQPLHIEDI